MKTKQLSIAGVIVISAIMAATGCKKEETPVKGAVIHKDITWAAPQDTSGNLGGGSDHPIKPPH